MSTAINVTGTAFVPGFSVKRLQLGDALIHAEVGGNGPPLLLLHGYPQTHVAWHRIAPELAKHFTVVAPDLRGYGDSTGPGRDANHAGPGAEDLHANHSKRTLAQDNLALMQSLGFTRFAVMGHDRGGRVGYRLALDHPQAVSAFVSLTVVPTEAMWARAGMAFGMKAWHWFMFAQPYDLPERMLAADPGYFLDWTLRGMVQRPDDEPPAVSGAARAEYHRAFAKAEVRHAMLEDYRAAATLDLEHDRADLAAGRKLQCPVKVLWSASYTARPTPAQTWAEWASHVEGGTIDCGHLMAEEAPEEVLAQVLPFLQLHADH